MVAPVRELMDELFREKVRAARRMSAEERFLAGPRLFEFACEFARAGIRLQHPRAAEAEVRERLRHRLALAERLESHG